ncbi:lycopene beta-cyclase CrtY [Erythrobacteraceae bacterium WH01K]|nr:lycopene beta-cyclase CrtY [Erythrobacteraceae bacterium WH01K]
MTDRRVDIAIAGGGLAGGLIALALRRARPELSVALIERGDAMGGNHRWSWFASDLPDGGEALLAPFRKTAWQGYDVRFPAHERTLAAHYRSLSSEDFDAALRRELAQDTLLPGREIANLDARGITLADGSRVDARAVIDCRGFLPHDSLRGGWQVFMGRHLRTDAPHGLERPVIMDAAVDQLSSGGAGGGADGGAYRFVYVLPLGVDELFVEDTYYDDSPVLDRRALSSRIDAYCRENGWQGEILGGETGVLPVITGGSIAEYQQAHGTPGVAKAGAAGLMVHPLTSYTLPHAVETALLVANNADLPGDQLAALLDAQARRVWKRTGFYRLLGQMLFGAARPAHRYRVFERFYRLPEPLIERFYAARSTFADRLRILSGRPPVPVIRAIGALLSSRDPLTAPQQQKDPSP